MTDLLVTDDDRWAAVVARDDADFYYSVRTTGVYCRPSCAARRPRRENVAFHAPTDAAERAGFRPCRRCRPDESPAADRRAAAVAAACRAIEAARQASPSVDDLAVAAGMSRSHFHRAFKEVTGLTPKAYATAVRNRRVQAGLAAGSTTATVTEAIYDAGFNSNGRFYATSSATLGMTPTAYRAGGAGTTIRFAVGECSLGSVLVAASDTGVCAIFLGDDPDALVHALEDRFPTASLAGGAPDFERWTSAVVALVDDPRIGLDLPLDVRGTAFQQRVWQALRAIPVGTTQSYSEIAAAMGIPTAARAVAAACAANKIAVAIPCHRVVRRDGSLSGYRWGVDRKRLLLEREATT
ncbi:MAG TPA: bifunctional DNA-binding transcriptional regulator/O6-methylguanine-DNA methyltransferase Ada [Acidimicrobiales bacterium]|nr:bifunctional DNA-binding transcriptional regulator/O6-methylguanine-DNA methyltransferase Ada [Acidimicrobiales bacterium]